MQVPEEAVVQATTGRGVEVEVEPDRDEDRGEG